MASLTWDTLLGDGSQLLGASLWWSDYEFDCSTLFAPVRQAQDGIAQRIQGAWGLAMGGMTLDAHGRPHGLRPQGRPAHKMKPYGA